MAFRTRLERLLAELRGAAAGSDGSFVWVAATTALPDRPTIFAMANGHAIDVVLAGEYAAA